MIGTSLARVPSFVVAVLLLCSVAPAQPSGPVPAETWPPGWEVWIGFVAGPTGKPGAGCFHLERVNSPGDQPSPLWPSAKSTEIVTLQFKRGWFGGFSGTITYHAGLRPFTLNVTGQLDEQGRITFTEEIDPKNVPQWHRWPWQFIGTVGKDMWTGEVTGAPGAFPFVAPMR